MNTWMTHQISNQFDEKQDYNLYETDTILQEILQRYGSQDRLCCTNLALDAYLVISFQNE